jgi:hypothetical protein
MPIVFEVGMTMLFRTLRGWRLRFHSFLLGKMTRVSNGVETIVSIECAEFGSISRPRHVLIGLTKVQLAPIVPAWKWSARCAWPARAARVRDSCRLARPGEHGSLFHTTET